MPTSLHLNDRWRKAVSAPLTKHPVILGKSRRTSKLEEDIETISSYISCNPPETSGELLKLRELQRKYSEIAESIKNEIVKLG
jgi:hypothetical protein